MDLPLQARTPCVIEETVGAEGYPLKYRAWRPTEGQRGTVVLLNGIMSHSSWFFPLVDPWVEAGFAVVGADRRGSGLNEQARGDAPSAAAIIEDAMAVIEAAVPPGEPLLLVGWCWGSVLALNLLKPLGGRLTALIMVAPGLFPTQAVSDAAKAHEADAEGAAEDAPAIVTPIAETMFTRGPYLDAWVYADDRRLMRITPRFRKHMAKLAMGATMRLRKLSVPTLLLLAEGDEATDNDAVDAAMAKLPEGVVERHATVSGHAMQFDVPAFVTGRVIDFFEAL
jgi:alpha-beta hydrolase superfamily lysophospholipase